MIPLTPAPGALVIHLAEINSVQNEADSLNVILISEYNCCDFSAATTRPKTCSISERHGLGYRH